MKYIDTIEKWNILAEALLEKGYSRYCNQYNWDCEEGFHSWFMSGDKRVQIQTYNEDVQRAIVSYENPVLKE